MSRPQDREDRYWEDHGVIEDVVDVPKWKILEDYNYLNIPMGDMGLWVANQMYEFGNVYEDVDEARLAWDYYLGNGGDSLGTFSLSVPRSVLYEKENIGGVGVGAGFSVPTIEDISRFLGIIGDWVKRSDEYHREQIMGIITSELSLEQKLENLNNVDDSLSEIMISMGSAFIGQAVAKELRTLDSRTNDRAIDGMLISRGEDLVKWGSFDNAVFYASMYGIKSFIYRGLKYNTSDYADEGDSVEEWSMLSPKRGNLTYSNRLYGKFIQYKEKFSSFVGSVSKDFTKSMMVTLTVSREQNLNDAWMSIGEKYNVFITRLKDWVKRYCGKLPIVFRSWEVHRDLYPHIHCLIVFPFEYTVKRKRTRKGEVRYYVEESLRDKVKGFWTHGFVDVAGVVSIYDAFSYIAKYAVKIAFDLEKNVEKLAILWLYGKRMWSVSRVVRLDKREINSSVVCLGLSDRFGVFVDFTRKLKDSGKYSYEQSEFFDAIMKKHLFLQQKL